MAKKVVEGGPIHFKEDLPIAITEIPKPLGLPPLTPLPDRFTVWYLARFFELDRAAGNAVVRIWDRAYTLREVESAHAREECYRLTHRDLIRKAQEQWLSKVLSGNDLSKRTPQVAQVLKDKLEELCAVPLRPPQPQVGKGTIKRPPDPSVLAEMHGYERLLFLDGKMYDLLTLAEYVAKFEKAFQPEFLRELQKEGESLTPAEFCERMHHGLDRMDKKAYGVIKGKVHYDRRTFELLLDGTYFIPEYVDPVNEFMNRYTALFEKTLKMEAIAAFGI